MDKISTRIIFEEYMKRLDFNKLFEKLQVSDKELLTKEIEHFTKEEAERRDQIIINYLEESGINRIVEKIIELLLVPPKLPLNAKILDLGAGT